MSFTNTKSNSVYVLACVAFISDTPFTQPTSTKWFLKKKKKNQHPPFNDGSLGSCNDEERRETRYVMWIAGLSESSNLWTQIAAPALAVGACLVQTRLPNAKWNIESTLGVAGRHRFKNRMACPLAFYVMRRGSQTPRCVMLVGAAYKPCFRAGLR